MLSERCSPSPGQEAWRSQRTCGRAACSFFLHTDRKDRRRPFIDWLCMMRGAERAYTEREGSEEGGVGKENRLYNLMAKHDDMTGIL